MVKTYYMSNGDIQLSPHFMLHEFQCHNGADKVLVDNNLIDMLEAMRTVLNASSVIINSGYREAGAYNRSIAGGDTDAHTFGMAADTVFYDGDNVISGKRVCCAAQDLGFGGIGYMGNAVHLDVRHNGGYYNTHWWGDELTGKNVSDWHSYFEINEHFSVPDNTGDESGTDNSESETGGSEYDIDGGKDIIMNKSREQLQYEVNRYALTVLGRSIPNADAYTERLISDDNYSWYDFTTELQECAEGVKYWIRNTWYRNILNATPTDADVEWWYTAYANIVWLNKELMAEQTSDTYADFFQQCLKG